MSNVDYSSCLSVLEAEVQTYQTVVLISLAVTLICAVVRSCKAETFKENPSQGATILFSFGILKVILGIALLIAFPGCPQVCDNSCTSTAHHFVYPTIVFVVAGFWFNLGNKYRKLAQSQQAVVGSEGGHMMVEATSPTAKELV